MRDKRNAVPEDCPSQLFCRRVDRASIFFCLHFFPTFLRSFLPTSALMAK